MSSDPDRSRKIPLHPAAEPAAGIPRRAALQALLGGAGAGLALPSIASAQHPMHRHLSNPEALAQAQQQAAVTAPGSGFLDPHQTKTLEALAEAIVPGSTAAGVGRYLDQLLAVESAADQQAFLGALGAFDMAAIATHGKPWTAIAAAQQDALLQEASTAEAASSSMRGHFEHLKTWIAGAYYTSEPGMRELGWGDNWFHQELPRCTHPGGHQA